MSEFSAGSFDICHSNSVVEHVGSWACVKQFASEMRRVGKQYYGQTPYFWFPLEPHYLAVGIHWLPRSWRTKLLQRRSIGHFPQAESIDDALTMMESVEFLDRSMFSFLFHDAQIHTERFVRLPKSLIAVRGPSVLETNS